MEKSDLNENAGLIPIDVLAFNFPVGELDNSDVGNLNAPPRRCDTRKEKVHADGMRALENESSTMRLWPTVREIS